MKCKNNNNSKLINLSCPSCKFENIVKRGIRKTDNRGEVQRFGCKDCKKRFVIDTAFTRMRNHEDKITLCMDLYYRGVSFRKIQEHLQSFYPRNSHYSTIYRWLIKLVPEITRYTDKLPITSGNELQSDEMEYHRLGEKNWFVDVIDTENRYMVSSDYFPVRDTKALVKVLKKAKDKTGAQVKVIATDALNAYPRALSKTFGYNPHHKKNSKIIHRVTKSDSGTFNFPIERLHNTIRERTKIMRGFHGAVESATALMKGFEIYYNFIRKHQSIGVTPSEVAIPTLEFKEKNRWLELINRGFKMKSR